MKDEAETSQSNARLFHSAFILPPSSLSPRCPECGTTIPAGAGDGRN